MRYQQNSKQSTSNRRSNVTLDRKSSPVSFEENLREDREILGNWFEATSMFPDDEGSPLLQTNGKKRCIFDEEEDDDERVEEEEEDEDIGEEREEVRKRGNRYIDDDDDNNYKRKREVAGLEEEEEEEEIVKERDLIEELCSLQNPTTAGCSYQGPINTQFFWNEPIEPIQTKPIELVQDIPILFHNQEEDDEEEEDKEQEAAAAPKQKKSSINVPPVPTPSISSPASSSHHLDHEITSTVSSTSTSPNQRTVTLFDYDDETISNMSESELATLVELLKCYSPPQLLAPHQIRHASRIPSHANILFWGKSGHGKSSFINSLDIVLGNKMNNRAIVGSFTRPGTQDFLMYDCAENYSLYDTRGQISFSTQENEELLKIMSRMQPLGHINRESDRSSALVEKYNHYSKPRDDQRLPLIHIAVLVVSKDATNEDLIGISNFVESLRRLHIRVVAILTKTDEIKDENDKEIIQQKIQTLSSFGIAKVIPVINYPNDTRLKRQKDPRSMGQVIIAMKHILANFETFTYHFEIEKNSQEERERQIQLKWYFAVAIFVLFYILFFGFFKLMDFWTFDKYSYRM